MTDPRRLGYLLVIDSDTVPLEAGMTIGRHLDNDLVIAGEDVLDFHLRLDLSLRGPIAVPLVDAVLYRNGALLDLPTGLMPGDRLEIGQSQFELASEPLDGPEAEAWRLIAPGDLVGIEVADTLYIGRDPASDLQLTDLHTSRRHARLANVDGSVWVEDLDSANGTFVNGERVRGAQRVFHGDEIRFDHHVCQLLGRGADLTPPRASTERDEVPFSSHGVRESRADGNDTVEFAVVPRPAPEWSQRPDPIAAGLYLVGARGVVATGWQRLPMGRTLIGRRADCDLQLRDRSVSGHHAEIVLRPEGATITDLMSSNGTLCNARPVQSVRLSDGDRLMVGRIDLQYREIAGARTRSRRLVWLVVLALAAAAGAVALVAL